mgnify:CR=1 FL=1
MMSEKFYSSGLKFSCIRCGKCCCIRDGVVYLQHKDIQRLAKYFQISEKEFLRKYTHTEDKHIVLNDFPNGNCIFFDSDNGCTVYKHRPAQCRIFPFWEHIISSRENWEKTARECPGINTGKLYSPEEIEQIINFE